MGYTTHSEENKLGAATLNRLLAGTPRFLRLFRTESKRHLLRPQNILLLLMYEMLVYAILCYLHLRLYNNAGASLQNLLDREIVIYVTGGDKS